MSTSSVEKKEKPQCDQYIKRGLSPIICPQLFAYRALQDQRGIRGSMSRKGNCWNNVVKEPFFLDLKMERIWQRDSVNDAESQRDITEYIVGFYNSIRLHSKLGYLPPHRVGTENGSNTLIYH